MLRSNPPGIADATEADSTCLAPTRDQIRCKIKSLVSREPGFFFYLSISKFSVICRGMTTITPQSTSVKILPQDVIKNFELTDSFNETSTHLTNEGQTARWHFSDLSASLKAVLKLTELEIPHLFIDDDKQEVMIAYDWSDHLEIK